MELSHLDRNLDGLVQELAARCQQVFSTASHAAARSAVISVDGGALPPQAAEASAATVCLCVRQRVIYEGNEVNSNFFFFPPEKGVFLTGFRIAQPDGHLQYLAIHLSSEGRPLRE